jgi:exodeoxyribonuclease X
VIVTSAIFVELLGQAKWSELMQWSAEPALVTVFGFSKHRGQRFDAAPRDYLEWIADEQNDLREDVKFSARYWLQKHQAGPT